MYQLRPARVYMFEEVRRDERALRRMERMLDAIDFPRADVVEYSAADLPAVIEDAKKAWSPEAVLDPARGPYTRPLVFTMLQLEGEKPALEAVVEGYPEGTAASHIFDLLGWIEPVRKYHRREDDWVKNYVCWPTNDFGTMTGCPHGCQYCGAGKSGPWIAIGLNLEELMETVVPRVITENPWQKCFRMIGWSADHIAFEPEYGCIDLYTRTLAAHDRWGYFHSTSANVEWIADLERKDRLIGVWSTTCETVARDLEPGAGSALERIEAAAKCQAMGIPVRFKFKPMIPVRNWREEYAQAIEDICRLTTPESIGFCVIMWTTLDGLASMFDLDLLDQEFVAAARNAAEQMQGVITGPFPHEVRVEIYRYLAAQVRRWDQEVPLYVSTESRELWAEVADDLGQRPEYYLCGCSSVSLPGRKLALSAECPHSTYKRIEEPATER